MRFSYLILTSLSEGGWRLSKICLCWNVVCSLLWIFCFIYHSLLCLYIISHFVFYNDHNPTDNKTLSKLMKHQSWQTWENRLCWSACFFFHVVFCICFFPLPFIPFCLLDFNQQPDSLMLNMSFNLIAIIINIHKRS